MVAGSTKIVPAVRAQAEIRFFLPWANRALAVGLVSGVQVQDLSLRVADPRSFSTGVTASVVSIPVMAKLAARLHAFGPISAELAFGAGAYYANARSAYAGVTKSQTRWVPACRVGLDLGLHLGSGWLAAGIGYVLAGTRDFGSVVQQYNPGGADLGVRYGLGF
jgi:hypothetical protein